LGVFPRKPVFHDRPVWGIFCIYFPDYRYNQAEYGMNGITWRKTGLFKPVWTKDHLSGYLTSVEMGKKRRFYD